MAAAHDHVPAMTAQRDRMGMDQSLERRRQRHYTLCIAALVAMEERDLVVRYAVTAKVCATYVFVLDEVVARGDSGHVLAERHEQRRVPAFAQPAGEADMVGVQVRANDPSDRLAAQL